MLDFIPGLEISEALYLEVVKPILTEYFPHIKYSAALVGTGSDVLGFDTQQSTDHYWGPKLDIFLSDEDYSQYQESINQAFSNKLPFQFKGISTNFSKPVKGESELLEVTTTRPINHHIYIHTMKKFIKEKLNTDPSQDITTLDWLTFSEQALLEITKGKVFYDGLEQLNPIREKFVYYPHEVWLYLLASQWLRISQEEAFVGRCGDVGDEIGSKIVAARIVRELIKLCFLMEKKYAPYSKWLGTAFSKLLIGPLLIPIFDVALSATNWKEREQYLSQAYEIVAQKHNELKITPPLDPHVSNYHDRPYMVINADRFVEAIKENLNEVKIQGRHRHIGSVNQFIDSTDVLCVPELLEKLKTIYLLSTT